MQLEGKRIIILGGTAGIGLSVARLASEEGATVVVASSNQARIDRALKTLPPSAKGAAIDLKSEESIRTFFNESGEFDHLVYTAGEPLLSGSIEALPLKQAQEFFDIRFWGTFLAVKYGARQIKKGGSIALSSGMASRRAAKGRSVVASVCGAVEALTRQLAVELAPIRVNLVCPGLVKTELWDVMPEAARETMYRNAEKALLTGRAGEPDELAEAYLYVMKSGFSTGQVIVVDGGASVGVRS
jgi:NAD(P)-dependent dehydrogenase (short-subunit alcohol dehydrogenase family)